MHNKPARFHFFLQGWAWLNRQFRQKSLQHFVFAVIVSAFVHAYFIQAIWHFFNPTQQNIAQNRTISARLQHLEKYEEKILEKVLQKKLEKNVKKRLVESPPPPAPKVEEVITPEPIAQSTPTQELPPLNETKPTDTPENNQDSPKAGDTEAVDTAEASVSENEDQPVAPYQYVESSFEVFTDTNEKPNRSAAGTAIMLYQTIENGEQYQLKNTMSPKGLAALVIPDLLQTSEGMITAQGLQPQHYLYQFGSRKNKTYRAEFDWQTNIVTLHNAKGTQTLPLAAGTQDLLSFMYQFMFAPPLNEMLIKITNGKKLSQYDYSFEGEEVLETKLGRINTVHLSHDALEREEKTEIWLATDYRYLPVKIRKLEKKDKVYEMVVKTIHTDLGNLSSKPDQQENTP